MKFLCCISMGLMLSLSAHATLVLGPWIPIYKGIDRLVGTNFPGGTTPPIISTNQVGNALRIDLTDPDVKLFTDPPCTNQCVGETVGYSTSRFLETYKLQAAINCSYFDPCCSEPDGSTRMAIRGLSISQGRVVSTSQVGYTTELLFTTNNVPTFLANDTPPTNTAGIYTALNGDIPIVTNGVNAASSDPTQNPRMAIGISQDRRYLYLLAIDGRQAHSTGATDSDTAKWMIQLGAYQALSTDGGGSTAMVMANCPGKAIQLNSPIHAGVPGQERVVPNHLGIYAKPIEGFITNVRTIPGSTNATITWETLTPANSQVAYGLTTNYTAFSNLDPSLTTSHSVVLSGLLPGTNYFIRIFSSTATGDYQADSCVSTTNLIAPVLLFDPTASWRYTVDNLDGVNWRAPGYSDANWTLGTGILWADTRSPGSPSFPTLGAPRGTQMPINGITTWPYLTYYFRKHFTFPGSPTGATLVLSNYVDDGAVFYLNGVEIQRLFMAAAPAIITNNSTSAGFGCTSGNATCPLVFTLSGDILTNLYQGDNVLAVEVHNSVFNSPDVSFGAGLLYTLPAPAAPKPFINDLSVLPAEDTATITWTTQSNSTTQVEYGLTPGLGSFTTLNSTLTTNHTVQLTGLSRLTPYYFRVISTVGADTYNLAGLFKTVPYYRSLVAFTNIWRYTTNNLDAVAWKERTYDDGGWLGQGPALLYVETNPDVLPKGTPLPGTPGSLPRTYYFRSHFQVTGSTKGFSLVFSNFIDDAALFYLNGKEIQRVRMTPAPQVISYVSLAESAPPSEDAVFPDVFRIGGDAMTNLVAGDNVLAAEVHQRGTVSSDIVFGSEIGLVRALPSETKLRVLLAPPSVCISWDGLDMFLQETTDLGNPASWHDVAGAANLSPHCAVNPTGTVFYRLRN